MLFVITGSIRQGHLLDYFPHIALKETPNSGDKMKQIYHPISKVFLDEKSKHCSLQDLNLSNTVLFAWTRHKLANYHYGKHEVCF